MSPQKESYNGLSRAFKLSRYTKAYSTSSARVRYVCIFVLVVMGVAVAGYWSSTDANAFRSRVEKTRKALVKVQECLELQTAEEQEKCIESAEEENHLVRYFSGQEDLISFRLEALEEAYVHRLLLLELPILGSVFDLNDLGVFSGVGFVLVMGYLLFAVDRQYQTLALALWKAEHLCEIEKCEDEPDSDANLFYHDLAMVPVFATPPILYRWSMGRRSLLRFFFLLPSLVHGVIVWSNLATLHIGKAYRPDFPRIGIPIQLFCWVLLLAIGVVCILYSRASNRRWERTFAQLNPRLSSLPTYSWRERLYLRKANEELKEQVHEALGFDRDRPRDDVGNQ